MKLKKGKVAEKIAKKHMKKKTVVKTKKKNIAEITTDEFFNQDFENMDISDDEEPQKPVLKSTKKSIKKDTKEVKKSSKENGKDDSDSGESDLEPAQHKKSLMNLQETDPEFFKYLKMNDTKLLDFNVDDEIDNLSSADEDDLKHIPDDDLEIGSDESDYEVDGNEKMDYTGNQIKVTLKLIKTWQEEIQQDKSSKTIKSVIDAFHATLETVSDSENQNTKYKVDGAAIFNGIIQLCVLELPKAFQRFLKLGNQTKFEAHKAKRFPKVKGALKNYLSDLIMVFQCVSSPDIIITLLKHLYQMLPYTQCFSSLRKPLLRILLKYWSVGAEETIQVVAFLCIVKIATSQSPAVHSSLLKTMYIKYIENSKFVSPVTLPGINFMRRSLVEMYLLDCDFSYTCAFMYIRQLAIHLRNALTLKKKEHFQAVYNWQYINSLWFWSQLVPLSDKKSLMRHLIYPLVQITIGVINLIPTSQYYPLRFHCVKMLINISKEAGVFIPSLPLLIQVLEEYEFDRKHKAVSMKPISLMCMLRVSKSQARENGYKDAIIENIYELILETAAKDSYAVYYPDLYVLCIIKLKEFLKKCHVANYCRKMKQLLAKIEENKAFIQKEREKQSFNLQDMKSIEAWEAEIKAKGPPILKFYDSWIKVHQAQKMKLITQNDETSLKLPSIKKSKRGKKQDDSDENSDLEIPVEEMERRLKKSKVPKKKVKSTFNEELPRENTDIVQDIKSSDWD